MGSLMGADAYRKYLEHFEATGHSGPAMTEREFWRDRMDRQDSNPPREGAAEAACTTKFRYERSPKPGPGQGFAWST